MSTIRVNKYSKVTINSTKWNIIQIEIKKFQKAVTAIGIHPSATTQDGSSTALIASVNEFGTQITVTSRMRGFLHSIGIHLSPNTTTITIPERSWMRSWVDNNHDKIGNVIAKLYGKVLDGKLTAKQAIALLGAYAEGGLKKSMVDLKLPANHPVTIERKGSSNPLIDTGGTLSHIKHKEFMNGKVPK